MCVSKIARPAMTKTILKVPARRISPPRKYMTPRGLVFRSTYCACTAVSLKHNPLALRV